MNWIELNTEAQLKDMEASSEVGVIFKHSTRCPVSSMAKRNLEYDADLIPEGSAFYYLDLIRYRDLSNMIAEKWSVTHESPQILVVQGNQCIYHVSHSDIEMESILPFLK